MPSPRTESTSSPSVASPIATDVAALDAWWRRDDPTRAPRLDLFAFPGCAAGIGQLDISAVRLPQPASAYRAVQSRLQRIATDLGAAGLNHRFKKYLVFYDEVVDDTDVCGTGFLAGEQGGVMGSTAIFLQAAPGLTGCGTLGLEDELAATVAHELLHGFGAVPAGAPHACPRDPGHICGDDRDVPQATAQARPLGATVSTPDATTTTAIRAHGSTCRIRPGSSASTSDFALVVTPVGAVAGEAVASDLPGTPARRRAPGVRVGHPCQPDALADPSGPPLRRLAAPARARARATSCSTRSAGWRPCGAAGATWSSPTSRAGDA